MAVSHRIYADALFQAAEEQGRLEQVREDLGDFVEAIRQVPELEALLTNPEIDPAARRAALEDVLERLVAVQERRLEVELTTAVELSDDEAQEIVKQIEQAAGRTVEATRKVDSDLVGGFVLQAGSFRVDASVRGRLERLRHDLARS